MSFFILPRVYTKDMKFLHDIHSIHFIGIGGVGMSAMAKYAKHHGIVVTGSDASASEITRDLQNNYDIPVNIGTYANNITENHDLVVYSPAVPEGNRERERAYELDINQLSYPQMLGGISKDSFTIAIAGTNGKTTTTAMAIEVLKNLGLNPTGIIGAKMQKYGSNFIPGQSDYFITEACEYKQSFLNIHHDVLVITNISEDHLDYFKDLADIQETFKKFIHNKKSIGTVICNTQLEHLQPIIAEATKEGMNIIDYSKYHPSSIELLIPGEHNKQNAATTLAVVEALGESVPTAKNYLAREFKGVERRMEHVGMTTEGIQIFDDYAHNPEGLDYLIAGLREFYPEKKIIMLFEPHLYSRTRDFKNEFARALEAVDVLYLFPTYRAREEEIPQENYLLEQYIDTTKVELMTVSEPENFPHTFKTMGFTSDYIVISAGAGDIWKHAHALKKTTLSK